MAPGKATAGFEIVSNLNCRSSPYHRRVARSEYGLGEIARPNTSSSGSGLPSGVSKRRLVEHTGDVQPDRRLGEAAAGAAAVPGAEGQIGGAGQGRRHGAILLRQETLRDELVGRVPVARIVVDGVDVAQHLRSQPG